MPVMNILYSDDEALLKEIYSSLGERADVLEEPNKVEAPKSLNLDLASFHGIWQLLTVFGSIKASVEAIQIILKIIRERQTNGKSSKVEYTTAQGIKIVLDGNMKPEKVAEEIRRYETALNNAFKAKTV